MARVLLDRYALQDVIGAGGAATVYRAVDRTLDRVVAVKLLDAGVARSADPGGRDRFLNEATSAARFQHPNLVTVYDAGEDAGVLFLVMELVEGRTLADVIAERAPLPVDEATSVAIQMLRGLAAVHAQGTIHRDVKPANILVDDRGRVRLTDFGIAKRLDDIDAAITAFGFLVGTPHYLAPEQAAGRALSPATDLYQVGIVLHEMLTGVRAGGSSPATATTATAVDPRRWRDDVPAGVAEAVVRATQSDPELRFGSAEAMIAALTGGVAASGTTAATAAAAAAVARGTGPGGTRTMAITASIPTHADTAVLPGSAGHETDELTTMASSPLAPPPLGSEGARRRRPWVIGGLGALAIALIGSLAVVARDDTERPILDTGTTLPGTTVPAIETSVATAPQSPAATAPPPDIDDRRGDEPGNGKNKGNGNGKKKRKD